MGRGFYFDGPYEKRTNMIRDEDKISDVLTTLDGGGVTYGMLEEAKAKWKETEVEYKRLESEYYRLCTAQHNAEEEREKARKIREQAKANLESLIYKWQDDRKI